MILLNFPTSKVRILDLLRFERVSSLFSASFLFATKLLRMSFAVSLLSPRTLRNFFACLSQFRLCPPAGRSVSLLSPRRPLGLRIVPPKAARFAYCPLEGRLVSLLSSRRPLGFLIASAKAARLPYCPSEGRLVSVLSPRKALGFLIVLPKAARLLLSQSPSSSL